MRRPVRELAPAARPRIDHARLLHTDRAALENNSLMLRACAYEVNSGSVTALQPDAGA